MDFGELKNDTDFINKTTKLSNSLDEVKNCIEEACDFPNYETLTTEEKVKFDLFLSYSINSLFWMWCKLQNIDVSEHGIRNEMSRVRQAMIREKQLEERRTIRPVLNVEAARRFIRHGLWDKDDKNKKNKKGVKRKFEMD